MSDTGGVYGRQMTCWMCMEETSNAGCIWGRCVMARWRSTLNGGGVKKIFCGCGCRRLGQNSNTGSRHLGEPVHAYLHGYKCILGVMRKMLNEVL